MDAEYVTLSTLRTKITVKRVAICIMTGTLSHNQVGETKVI